MTREEETRLANGEYLSDTVNRLERERNQAVEDIRMLGRQGQFICPVCSHYDHGKGMVGECVKCLRGEDCFEWRGVQHG